MKSLTEHLDKHFGTGCWLEVGEGSIVEVGDMFEDEYEGLLAATHVIGEALIGCVAYRAKPKPEPKKSEKFWTLWQEGEHHSTGFEFNCLDDAKEKAAEISREEMQDYYILEAVGIARAPKAVEYEGL